jgi:hypothetical protein
MLLDPPGLLVTEGLEAFQREEAPDFTAGHAPGADDLGDAVDAKADDRAEIHAGDLRRFPRHELVDHLGRAHLGHCDRKLAQGLVLVEELADSFLGARSTRRRESSVLAAWLLITGSYASPDGAGEGFRAVRVRPTEALPKAETACDGGAVVGAVERVDEVAVDRDTSLDANEPMTSRVLLGTWPPEVWVVTAREPPGFGLRSATAIASRELAAPGKG